MVSDIRLQIWRDEIKAMPDDELRFLAASGRVSEHKLQLVRLEIQDRDRASEDAGKRDSMALACEANEIARNANTIATKAERNAIVAAIAAVVSAIAAVVAAYAMF
jgi:hypothetical protein